MVETVNPAGVVDGRWCGAIGVTKPRVTKRRSRGGLGGSVSHPTKRTVKRVGQIAGGVGWVLLFWVWLRPVPYGLALVVCALAPVASWALCLWSGRQLALVERRGGGRIALDSLAWMPALGLALRALIDVQLFDWQGLLAGGVVVGAAFTAITWRVDPASFAMKLIWGFIAILGATYGWGLLALIDKDFDSSPAAVYRTEVLDKQVSHGRSTTHRLSLSPWGPQTKAGAVDVDRGFYDQVEKGQTICVALHPGFLRARWFALSNCADGRAGRS